MIRRWVAALLAAFFTVVSGPASTASDTAAHVYDTVGYTYDDPVLLSSPDTVATDARGSPSRPGAASWVSPVSVGGVVVAANTALPVVEGAAPKIASLASRYGEGIESTVLKSGTRYVDAADGGNINVFMARPDAGGFIRVTLDPGGQRVISA